jgi:hypothetical protein
MRGPFLLLLFFRCHPERSLKRLCFKRVEGPAFFFLPNKGASPMAASKPVALCSLVMPSGKPCRAIALRNQRFCRTHSATHRVYERERIHCEILDRLGEKIRAMDTSELLLFLHQKLGRLPKTIKRFPDIGYTLTVTLDRLSEITEMESILKHQIQQNQILLDKIRECQMNSKVYAQVTSNQ